MGEYMHWKEMIGELDAAKRVILRVLEEPMPEIVANALEDAVAEVSYAIDLIAGDDD